ncbi:MAG: DUF3604 domain-containing protein [Desulfobacterales bacterium]
MPEAAGYQHQLRASWCIRFVIRFWANPDRIQIVKHWLEGEGKTHEQVYNVDWRNGRKPSTEVKLPSVGNTVDIVTASWTIWIIAGPKDYLEWTL